MCREYARTVMYLSFEEREAMDAKDYWIAGFPVVGLFITLLVAIFCIALATYATTWSKVDSEELYSRDIFELVAGLSVIGVATGGTLLATYNFLWTGLALIVSGVPVVVAFYVLDNRREQINLDQ